MTNLLKKHFDADNAEIYGDKSDDNTEAWRLRVKELILGSNGIKEKVEKLGKPLTNLNLTTHEDSKIHVKGQIDLVRCWQCWRCSCVWYNGF